VIEDRKAGEGYANQLSARLFGKQSAYLPHREPVNIRPVGEMVRALCGLDDGEWTEYAFSREPLNGRFNKAERHKLMQQAIDCGRQIAEECISQYGASGPLTIAKALGLNVDYPRQPQDGGRVLFAEFCPPGDINIFMDAIDKAHELLSEPGVREALGAIHIPDVLLAHELFHYMEDIRAKEIWTKTYKIELWGIGPLRNRSKIVVLSEIAAMAFCKRLNDLPYSPYVMDAFLVYGYSADNATRLYLEMMTFADKTPGTSTTPKEGREPM